MSSPPRLRSAIPPNPWARARSRSRTRSRRRPADLGGRGRRLRAGGRRHHGGDFTQPSGRRRRRARSATAPRVRSIDLGGQPDSIAISPDGAFAAIAMENQRDEEFTPAGGEEGDLPQPPDGIRRNSSTSRARRPRGAPARSTSTSTLRAGRAGHPRGPGAGVRQHQLPRPGRGDAAGEQRHRDHRRPTGDGAARSSAPGPRSVTGIDTAEDGMIDQTGSITETPREPDAIGWIGDDHLATANEGDWKGGTRGWTIFDATTGEVVWDAGNTVEQLAVRTGLHIETARRTRAPSPRASRSPYRRHAHTPSSPPSAATSSRSTTSATRRDRSSGRCCRPPTAPRAAADPVAQPAGDLLGDRRRRQRGPGVGQRLRLGDRAARRFPSIVSGDVDGRPPIGWGALGALSADPGEPNRLYTATDAAYGPAGSTPSTPDAAAHRPRPRVTERPARRARHRGRRRPSRRRLLAGRRGRDGPRQPAAPRRLGRRDPRDGRPARGRHRTHLGNWGLEGVTVTGTAREQVFVAVQRPLWVDPTVPRPVQPSRGIARIGRYDVATRRGPGSPTSWSRPQRR